ncbi:hypothetical protein KUTeg_024304 [Tegillarca granosa]|uniref:Uncharacterized protein n=1 Tax=Tegillarca granosa TaxID=220873 RepID=A0ABQ9DWZ0_TEGGR|nr:hypothetical protein KUTeg_024304 [Tegillarca granosa]
MEHCISWNGKLICISKRSPHLLSTVYNFDCKSRSWEREDSFEIGDSDKIEIVQCRVRTELSIGVRLPVFNQTKVLDKGGECPKITHLFLRVTKCEFSKRNGNVTEEKLNFETEIFALTNEGYVLHFVNGKLVTAVPIEEEDIDQDACIHVVKPFSLGYDFVIVRGKQLIHAVDIRDSKVTASWSNISHVICDDFVGCGSTQILLLTNDFDCSWNNNWILTDFGVWQIDLEKDKRSKQEFDDKHNAVTAVDALRSRLQYELVNLVGNRQTFKREIPLKKPQELIKVVFLFSWNLRKMTMVCQSLSLIPNVNSVSLLQVDLLTTSGYQSNSFDDSKSERLIFSEDIGGHLAPKRRKLSSTDLSEQLQELPPLAHGTVISFCDIPKFGQLSSYNCYCLLHWNERREEDDSEVTEENIISKSKCVGEVCLTLQDVLTSKHDIDLEECLIHDSEVLKDSLKSKLTI